MSSIARVSPNSSTKIKNTQINFRLSSNLKEQFQIYCERKNISTSEFLTRKICEAIREQVDSPELDSYLSSDSSKLEKMEERLQQIELYLGVKQE